MNFDEFQHISKSRALSVETINLEFCVTRWNNFFRHFVVCTSRFYCEKAGLTLDGVIDSKSRVSNEYISMVHAHLNFLLLHHVN
jgi:hypothetical protein